MKHEPRNGSIHQTISSPPPLPRADASSSSDSKAARSSACDHTTPGRARRRPAQATGGDTCAGQGRRCLARLCAPSCRRSARGHPSRWRRGWRCPCARGSVAAFGSASRRSSAPCSGARRAGRSSRSRHAAACGRCQRSRRQIARVAVRGSHGKRRCGSAHTLLASARKGRRQRRSPRRRGGRRGHPLMEPVDASRLVDVSRWACACVAEASWWCSRPRQAAKA